MRSSNLNSVNALLEQVKENVDASVDAVIKPHVVNAAIMGEAKRMTIPNVGNNPPKLQNLPPGLTVQELPDGVTPHTDFAVNANQHFTKGKDDMATFMKLFMDKMDAQEKVLRNITNNCDGGGSGASGGANAGGFDAGGGARARYRRRKNILKYCWTHGAYAHDSRSCRNKKQGHVDTATFHNKRGGSVKFCNQQE